METDSLLHTGTKKREPKVEGEAHTEIKLLANQPPSIEFNVRGIEKVWCTEDNHSSNKPKPS